MDAQEATRVLERKLAGECLSGLHTNQHYPIHYNLDQTIKFQFRDSRGLLTVNDQKDSMKRHTETKRRLRKANQHGTTAHDSIEMRKIINNWQY
jgi:hypothetical protein